MRRAALTLILAVIVFVMSACVQSTAAQEALREIDAKPGEALRSLLESRGPTALDSRILAAIDRHKPVTVEARNLAGKLETQDTSSTSAVMRGSGSEEVAYVLRDGSELLVRSAVDSSGRRVLVSLTAR